MNKIMYFLRMRSVVLIIVLLALIAVGLCVKSSFLSILITMITYCIYALAYDLLLGYANQPSLGQSLFFGLGAYGMVLPIIYWHFGFWGSLGVALVVGAAGGLLVGFVAVRLTEAYHVIFTAVIASVMLLLANNYTPITGGSGGLSFQVAPFFSGWIKLTVYSIAANYFLVLAFGVAVFLLLTRLVSSPLGKVWVAIRENEQRVVSLGYNVYWYKLAAFVAASMLTALAGALYVISLRYVSADCFDFQWSVLPFVWVLIGGIGTLIGPIIGVVLFTLFQFYVSDWWSHYLILFGVLILVILRWAPQGIMGYYENIRTNKILKGGGEHAS